MKMGRLIESQDGVDTFQFDAVIPSLTDLAIRMHLPEPQFVCLLTLLFVWGALENLDGGFAFPDWVGLASVKAVTARANGRQHRAKPKLPDPEPPSPEPRVPGQRRLPLMAAIRGGASVPPAPSSSRRQ